MVLEQLPKFGVHLFLLFWRNCVANVGGIGTIVFFFAMPFSPTSLTVCPLVNTFGSYGRIFRSKLLTATLRNSISVKCWFGENVKLDGGNFDDLLTRNPFEMTV